MKTKESFNSAPSALRAVPFRIGIVGATGRVGTRLLALIHARTREWNAIGVAPRVVFVARSAAWLHDDAGIGAADVATALAKTTSDWRDVADQLELDAIIDCTASADVAARYPHWLARGIHVITPNKIASSAARELRSAIEHAQIRCGAELRDSTTVGAQLPLLSTLRELRRAGDRVERLEAVLSGTLSYVLGSVQAGKSLSQAIGEAIALGYAEPNPACDLSGEDAARKLVILLRAAGIAIELNDVERVPLLDTEGTGWLDAARAVDETWRARAALAQVRGERWIYRASYENGHARIAPERVAINHALAKLAPCENALILHSDLYRAAPLTIAGPGAGIELTAAGVFADLLAIAERHREAHQHRSVAALQASALRAAAGATLLSR